ncbi:MAG: hypothetical protein R2748_00850 [Bryobacterales bacterium]
MAAGTGLAALIASLTVLGFAGLYYPLTFVLLLSFLSLWWRSRLAEAIAVWKAAPVRWAEDPDTASALTGATVFFSAAFLAIAAMLALAPSVAHDSLMMHLPAARHYAMTGGLEPLPGQPYSFYPQGAETVMAAAYSLGGQPAVQLVHPLFFALALGAVFALARRLGAGRGASLFAAALLLATPFALWDGSVIKNDFAVAALQLLALLCAVGEPAGKGRLRLGVVLLATSLAVKQTAVFGIAAIGPVLLWRVRHRPGALREAALWAAIGVLVPIGWPLRSLFVTGNPLYPEEFGRLVGRVSPELGSGEAWIGVPVWATPWVTTFDGQRLFESPTDNPLGFFLLFSLPVWLAIGRRRPSDASHLAGVAALTYFLAWNAVFPFLRYAIALAGILYALAGIRFDALYRLGGPAVRVVAWGLAVYNFAFCLLPTMIVSLNGPQLLYFAGKIDRDEYLRRALAPYAAMERVASAGPHDCILGAWVTTAGYAPYPAAFHTVYPKSRLLVPEAAAQIADELEERPYRFLIAPDEPRARATLHDLPSDYAYEQDFSDGRYLVYRLTPPARLDGIDCSGPREYDTVRESARALSPGLVHEKRRRLSRP